MRLFRLTKHTTSLSESTFDETDLEWGDSLRPRDGAWPEPDDPSALRHDSATELKVIPLRRVATSPAAIMGGGVEERIRQVVLAIDDELAGRSTTAETQSAIDLVAHIYELHDYAATASYLRARPHVIELALEAREKLEGIAPRSRMAVEIITDPDSGEQHMYLVIAVNENDVEPIQDRLDQAWWFVEGARALGDMNVVVEAAR